MNALEDRIADAFENIEEVRLGGYTIEVTPDAERGTDDKTIYFTY